MKRTWIILAWVAMLATTPAALAVKVADITRLDGQRTNQLMGLGLVVGLKGTGDGGDYQAAIRPLAQLLSRLNDAATVRELAASQNVALVVVTATIPATGVRNGDKIDAYVQSVGSASSLRGGRLLVSLMDAGIPTGMFYAASEGPVVLEDSASPLHGVVKGGCVMEADWTPDVISKDGRFTLILETPAASWTTASTIAKIINDAESNAGETLAVAYDAKNVVVTIPQNERQHPDSFISRVQRLPVPILPTEARVVINDKTGTMILTGDVEISPVVISHKGLTISTISPPPTPTPRTPVTTERTIVKLDTTGAGGAKLQELIDALEVLRVPAEDRITIVKELHKSGKLHAKLITESQ